MRRYNTYDLDCLLDEGYSPHWFVGQVIDWHGFPLKARVVRGTFTTVETMVIMGRAQYVYGVEVRDQLFLECDILICQYCRAPTPMVLVGPGLHEGAWPSAYDPDTLEPLANLRDDSPVCATCQDLSTEERIRIRAKTRPKTP